MLNNQVDPREIIANDPYENISDDESEIEQVRRRISALDAERLDLKRRLLELEKKKKLKDPNFDYVEIPQSPQKSSQKREKKSQQKASNDTQNVVLPATNSNEEFLKDKLTSSGSTSYFVQKLQEVNHKEHDTMEKKRHMLAHRVYTFDGSMLKDNTPIDVDEQDEISGLNIDRRYIPSAALRKYTKDIKILRLPKLFSKVRAPNFQEPDYPNWVVLGIISKKSEPRMTNAEKPVKYLNITITDFQFELNILIFGKDTVEKYHKLRIGDLIAVLNPEVMPAKKSDINNANKYSTFSLKMTKDTNSILEIGHSKDLGFCQYFVKAKGKICGVPINKRISCYCEYHNELKLRQGSAKRVEINSAVSMRAPVFNGYQQTVMKSSRKGGKSSIRFEHNPDRQTPRELSAAESNRFLFTSAGASTAFFDDDYENPDILANLENKRRKIEEHRSNRKLEKTLETLTHKIASKREQEGDSQSRKNATLSMFQHGLMNQIGFDPTKGKASIEMLQDSTGKDSKRSEKQMAISDICNIKKDHVVLKPSKSQRREKADRRNRIYDKFMNQKQEVMDSDSDSSDGLDIV